MINLSRKTALLCLALGTCPFDHASAAPAAPAAPEAPVVPRAVAKRLTLWQRPAPAAFTARYTLTRHSSLLWDPLVVHGVLGFTASSLELRDDEPTGATTRMHGDTFEISANDTALPPGPAVQVTPAVTWLRDRLFALFAARDRDQLLKDARASIPRGPGQQLDLSPQRSHPAHQVIDHLRVRLDPDTGAVQELELVLVDGDRVTLTLENIQPAPPV
jgi:hypothetical protein